MRKLIFFLIKLGILAGVAILGYIVFKEYTHKDPYDYDSLIVLGAQVKEDGTLSNQLRLRLEKTLAVFKKKEVLIVTTGARGENEPIEEAVAMRDWLVQNGVPKDMVYAENKSINTAENIRFANQMLDQFGRSNPAIITSDYHLPRALAIAADEGLHPQGFASPTTSEYWLQNHFREVLSWGKYLFYKITGMR